MAPAIDATIGIKHGDTCTCQPLDPIALTIEPVILDHTCPAQRELHFPGEEVSGRIVITWPAAKYGALSTWGVAVHDADTGEQFTDVTAVRLLAHVADSALVAELQRLRNGPEAVTFRYVVAEMRVAEAA